LPLAACSAPAAAEPNRLSLWITQSIAAPGKNGADCYLPARGGATRADTVERQRDGRLASGGVVLSSHSSRLTGGPTLFV
jgi:hypothetical protein